MHTEVDGIYIKIVLYIHVGLSFHYIFHIRYIILLLVSEVSRSEDGHQITYIGVCTVKGEKGEELNEHTSSLS